MAYDQGYWHTDSCAEYEIDESFAGTHIAVYIRWCAGKGLLSNSMIDENSGAVQQLITGEMAANKFFEDLMGWKFWAEDLNEEGNGFAKSYYKQEYFGDYEDLVGEDIYVAESDVDFAKLSKVLDERLDEFRKNGPEGVSWYKKPNPWWKFW